MSYNKKKSEIWNVKYLSETLNKNHNVTNQIVLISKVIFNNNDLADEGHSHAQTDLRQSILNTDSMAPQDIEQNFKERVSKNYKMALKLSRASRRDMGNSFKGNSEYDQSSRNTEILPPKLRIISTKDEIKEENEPELEIGKMLTPVSAENSQTHLNIEQNSDQNMDQNELEQQLLENQNRINMEKVRSTTVQSHMTHSHAENHEEGGHHHHNLVKKDDGFLTCTILLIAMGIHGFFAMMAFGIEQNESSALNLFIALIVHKWSEALTVGTIFYFVIMERIGFILAVCLRG